MEEEKTMSKHRPPKQPNPTKWRERRYWIYSSITGGGATPGHTLTDLSGKTKYRVYVDGSLRRVS
jgi:hypothetical protein